jgi:hypothetical protein
VLLLECGQILIATAGLLIVAAAAIASGIHGTTGHVESR